MVKGHPRVDLGWGTAHRGLDRGADAQRRTETHVHVDGRLVIRPVVEGVLLGNVRLEHGAHPRVQGHLRPEFESWWWRLLDHRRGGYYGDSIVTVTENYEMFTF